MINKIWVWFKMTHGHKVRVFGVSYGDNGMNLLDQFLLLVIIKVHVPFSQTCLACSVLYQYKTNLNKERERI